MTIDLVDIDAPARLPRMNGNGQYKVVPPGAKKPVGYTRSTTVAKTIDDGQGLVDWGRRMVAIGLVQRADLLSTAALHTAETPETKKELNKVCSAALEAGGGTVRRDQGTAIHKMMELAHTDPTYVVPELHRAEIEAINACLERLDLEVVPEYSEMLCVLDDERIAGRPDIVVRHRSSGQLAIADLKTGATLLGAMTWSLQFAIPAHADARYIQGPAEDGSEDQRLDMPDVSKETAIILHVEPGGTVCHAYDLDLVRGRKGLDLAIEVRKFRSAAKSAKTPIIVERQIVDGGAAPVDGSPSVPVTSTEGNSAAPAGEPSVDAPRHIADVLPEVLHQARVAWVLRRIDVIKEHGDEATRMLATGLPEGAPTPKAVRDGATWTTEQVDAYDRHVGRVEAHFEIPFNDIDPAKAQAQAEQLDAAQAKRDALATPRPEPEPAPVVMDEGGPFAADNDVAALREIIEFLLSSSESKAMGEHVLGWSKQAHVAGHPWSMSPKASGKPTPSRRFAICAAALGLLDIVDLEADDPDAVVRLALAMVIGEDALKPALGVGPLLGTLTTDQAVRLGEIVSTHRTELGSDGTPQLVAAA